MKKNYFLLTLLVGALLLMNSCSSMMEFMDVSNAKTKMTEHNYTEALTLAADALVRSEGENTKAADLIIEIVNQGDAYYNNLITQYRQPNQENAPAKIYRAYEPLVELFSIASKNNLENFTVGGMNYRIEIKDYTTELNTARNAAGKVYYDVAVTKMDEGTLAGYRQAYANLKFVKSIYEKVQSPFTDIDSRMKTALNEGTIDIYVIVPIDLELTNNPGSMGTILQQSLNNSSDWVKFNYGPKVDLAFQAWQTLNTGVNQNSKSLIKFGQEIGADVVIYAAFSDLKSDDMKTYNQKYSFDGTLEGTPYVLNLNWNTYTKKTIVTSLYFAVDVKAQKTLSTNNTRTQTSKNITLYNGTYTISPDIWSTQTKKNFIETLHIKEPEEYKFANVGTNGFAYRTNYSSSDFELRDKTYFDENFEKFKLNAQDEGMYATVNSISNKITTALEAYL